MSAEKCHSSRTGTDEGGVCILSSLPAQQVQMSGNITCWGRVVAVRARREGHTPLLIVCVHGHAANSGQAMQLQHDLSLEMAQRGEDYVAIGDWNRTVEQN